MKARALVLFFTLVALLALAAALVALAHHGPPHVGEALGRLWRS